MKRALLIPLAIALTSTQTAFGTGQKPQTPSTITVDFLVTDGSKEPVLDLGPDEITVKIAGRESQVHSLELITAGMKETVRAPSATHTAAGLPAPYGETAPPRTGTSRNILLLLDEGTLFGLDEILKKAVATLIESLDPADRVALTSTRPGGVNVNFTTNHGAIAQAIDTLVLGRGNTALCVGAVLEHVRGLAETLPKGRATTLALISRGSGSATSVLSTGPAVSMAGGCVFRRDQLAPVEEAVSAAQINYYVFHVGNTGLSPNLDNFAGSTGAQSGILSFTDASAIARAVAASSTFYRAVVDAPPPGRTYQRTEFRVTRPDVRVHAPKYLAAGKPSPPASDAAALLRGEMTRADLPLRVTAFASRNAGPQPLKLVVVVEPGDPNVPLYSTMVTVTAADGEIAGHWTARRNDLLRLPLVAAVPVNEGPYRVRAAAADEKGRGGVAEYEVTAALEGAGSVKLSALALGVSTPDGFAPRLLFTSEPETTAYLEIYDAPADA
ncbi:MAG TPA: VWA domain-containing protein, partial [Vicinamibacterales bacterium]